MQNDLLFILFLLFGVFMLIMLGQKRRISYPIFLVVVGLGVSFIPGILHISIDPELIFEGTPNDVPIAALSRNIEIDLREMLDEKDIPSPIQAVNNILM